MAEDIPRSFPAYLHHGAFNHVLKMLQYSSRTADDISCHTGYTPSQVYKAIAFALDERMVERSVDALLELTPRGRLWVTGSSE